MDNYFKSLETIVEDCVWADSSVAQYILESIAQENNE